MEDLTELKNIVRKGIVQSVNAETLRARVKFEDKGGIVSGDLHILMTEREVAPGKKEPGGNKTKEEQGHTHAAFITNWIPKVGSMVLCLMIPGGDGEGYVIGGVK